MMCKTGFLAILCVACFCSLAAAGDFAIVSVPDPPVMSGTTIDLPVSISSADSLYSYDFMVNYDPSVLDLTGMSAGPLIPGNWWFFGNTNNNSGTAYALAFSPMGTPLATGTGGGDILDLEFTVPASVPAGAYSSITVTQDPSSDPPLNDGSITMSPAVATGDLDVVPEPSTLALLMAAVAAAGLARARARRRA